MVPVTRVDGRPIGDGKPGPVTRRLRELFMARLEGYEGRPSARRRFCSIGTTRWSKAGVIHESMNLTLAAMGHQALDPRRNRDPGPRLPLRDTFPDLFRPRLEGREKSSDSFAAVHLANI